MVLKVHDERMSFSESGESSGRRGGITFDLDIIEKKKQKKNAVDRKRDKSSSAKLGSFSWVLSDNERALSFGSCSWLSRAHSQAGTHSSVRARGSLRGAIRAAQPPITGLIKCLTNSALCGLI